MTSRRMRLTRWVLRAAVKPLSARVDNPATARRALALLAALMPRAARVAEVRRADQCGAWWFEVPGADPTGPVILYLHGGAYMAGAPAEYRGMLGHLALRSACRIVAPVLRLAPEAPAPAAFDDAVAAHCRLLDLGIRPECIVIGGDSAGGGIALALLAHLCAKGLRPAGCFALSPWTDLALTGDGLTRNADADPLLPAGRMAEVVDLIRGCHPRFAPPEADRPMIAADDPRLSPLYATFDMPPPCLLMVGRDELLHDDASRMAQVLRDAGGTVTLHEVAGVFHAWPFAAGVLPEADDALREVAAFIHGLPVAAPG